MPSTMISRIDGLTTSAAVKPPIVIMTLAPIVLTGEQTITTTFPNGSSISAAVVSGDRVGVNGQADKTQNGIYVVSTTAWKRALDFNGSLDAVQGTLVLDSVPLIWRLTTPNPVRFGSSAITFEIEDGFNQDDVLITGKDLDLTDLNTIGSPDLEAFYFQPADAKALLTLNYPVQEAGELKALRGVGYGLQQEYTTYKNKKFIRALTGPFDGYGPWSPWVALFSTANPQPEPPVNPNPLANVPIGVPIPWPVMGPPANCAAMSGNSFSATLYPELALVYPTLVIPDLRGAVIRGLDNGRGLDLGRVILSWQGSAVPNITGSVLGCVEELGSSATGAFALDYTLTPGAGTGSDAMGFNFDASRSSSIYQAVSEARMSNIAFNYICRIL